MLGEVVLRVGFRYPPPFTFPTNGFELMDRTRHELSPARRAAMTSIAAGFVVACMVALGCETDSYMNPSVTGYYEHTPTTMPVLDRIDVIEAAEEPLGVTGPPEAQDLIANTLEYRIASGDVIIVEIYELISQGKTEAAVRRVDQGGDIRLPTINEIKAAGLTLEELRDAIRAKLQVFIKNPTVTVDIEEGRSFEFTIQGAIQNAGVFALNKPNFRLTQAIALAGGADVVTERVLIVRSMSLEDAITDDAASQPTNPPDDATPANPAVSSQNSANTTTAPPVDIEALINQLSGAPTPPPAPTPAPTPPPALPPSPGAVRGQQSTPPPPIDIDTLEPVSVTDAPGINAQTATQKIPVAQLANEGDSFIFDVNSQQWVRIRASGQSATAPVTVSAVGLPVPPGSALTGEAARATLPPVTATRTTDPKAFLRTRIIEVDYDRLVRGDASQNVVIRPGDDIYLQFPPIGMVYIDGEVSRPGVFQLPSYGRLTLSRLVATAGGLSQIAIPERVDLVRRLPGGREAAIRLNLAAIRNRGEPDVILKKDDYIVIGTNFWATPLAVFRNGLRMTYGFGFLLDRNWGNDVFGPPPQQETINF